MNRTVALSEFMPYGAPELQGAAPTYMARALLVGMGLTLLTFAGLGLTLDFARPGPAPPAAVAILLSRPPVPAPIGVTPPAAPATGAARRAAAAVPVPTADNQVPEGATIPSVDELRAAQPGTGTGEGPLVIEPAAAPETLPGVNEFVYVEEYPTVIRRVEPEYPAFAREAGVSGTVLTRLLVGRDGRVLDVKVDEHRSVPMLDDAAVAAARQWVFTPAYANGRPVAVWVAVPFSFRLQ